MKFLFSLYALSLYAYPSEFRARFGPEMKQLFRTRCMKAPRLSCLLMGIAQDLIATSLKERLDSMTTRLFARRLAYIATAAVLFLAVSTSMVQAYVIPTASMEPSLLQGDHLIVNKLSHDPQRDALIVFRYPVDSSQIFIKRVIGLPGDRIRMENKHVIRNGVQLTEDYAKVIPGNTDPYRDNFPGAPHIRLTRQAEEMLTGSVTNGEVLVPAGAVFVMGDNRDVSLDSRYFGFVPRSNVIGRPWFVYWSYDASARQTRWDRTMMTLPTR